MRTDETYESVLSSEISQSGASLFPRNLKSVGQCQTAESRLSFAIVRIPRRRGRDIPMSPSTRVLWTALSVRLSRSVKVEVAGTTLGELA